MSLDYSLYYIQKQILITKMKVSNIYAYYADIVVLLFLLFVFVCFLNQWIFIIMRKEEAGGLMIDSSL